MVHGPANVAAGIVQLQPVVGDSIADNAVDMGQIQDTAGSTADIVAAVDTIVQQSIQHLELQIALESLSWFSH